MRTGWTSSFCLPKCSVEVRPTFLGQLSQRSPMAKVGVITMNKVVLLAFVLATGCVGAAQAGGASGGGVSGGSSGVSSGAGASGSTSASSTAIGAALGAAQSAGGAGGSAMPNTSDALSHSTTGNSLGGINTNPSPDAALSAIGATNSAAGQPTPSNNSIQPNNARR